MSADDEKDFSAGGSDTAAWVGFDWSRERYDDLIGRVIPDYEAQHDLIARAVAGAAPDGGSDGAAADSAATGMASGFAILELGAGTGSLARHLLETFPSAFVTALDVSPTMLAECRRTLEPFGDRARVVQADLAVADLGAPGFAAPDSTVPHLAVPGQDAPFPAGRRQAGPAPARQYDAVVSRLAIHHLDHSGQEQLLLRVFAVLKPGGVFVNSDMIAADDETGDAALLEEWRDYMRARGDDPAEWEQWLVGDDDHPATEQAQLGWLRAAGFTEVQTIWKVASFAMLRGVKARGT